MKKILLGTLTICAALFTGCADSDYSAQGSAASTETESSTSISNSDPGVAAESGTAASVPENQSAEERFNTLGSASAPSANVPANVATNSSDPQPSASGDQNEQGTQTSPEPKTGDDANPDSVQPEK